jgi:hypothetical protein
MIIRQKIAHAFLKVVGGVKGKTFSGKFGV